jgi:hypothetical protein
VPQATADFESHIRQGWKPSQSQNQSQSQSDNMHRKEQAACQGTVEFKYPKENQEKYFLLVFHTLEPWGCTIGGTPSHRNLKPETRAIT